MPVIYTLSVCGRLILDLHDLNNEGTEGNQQMTRMVWVVVKDDGGRETLRNVNAISGDMIKHIHAEHLHKLSVELNRSNASDFPLSGGAQIFDTNRINRTADVRKLVEDTLKEDLSSNDRNGLNKILKKLSKDDSAEKPDAETDKENQSSKASKEKATVPNERLLDRIIKSCSVTDLMGTLITAGGLSLPRKSCVEYGWLVGIPHLTRTDSLFHVKYDLAGRSEGAGPEENRGQTIFYRPLNSGVYATVSHLELYRVGRNDLSLRYVASPASRKLRATALLQSLWHTFVKTSGAQRNTQHPHVLGFSGAITYSTHPAIPAPTVSPLDDEFMTQMRGATEALNRITPSAVTLIDFKDQSEFGNKMADIVEGIEVPAADREA